MPKPLETLTIAAPGFFGLNTQEASTTLQQGFALEATNCVIDELGRLGARKGWQYLTTTGGTSTDLVGTHLFTDVTGVDLNISWSDTTFYSGSTTLATITDNSTAFTTGNWDSATLNDKVFFVQSGETPHYYEPSTTSIEDLVTGGSTSAPDLALVAGANTILSAYGRIWLADTDGSKVTVYWSDLLDGTNFSTGTSGSLNLTGVFVKGTDEIIALSAHAGRLIIFCKDSIVIYADTDTDTALDPTTMQLVEVIKGVGCVARDSVQNTGTDILFLSNKGVMSLGRLIQEKSQPMRDLSKNIRDELVRSVKIETAANVRSAYDPLNAFYLLYLPSFNEIYCFDMRQPLEDGSARVTKWNNQTHNNLKFVDSELWFLRADGVATYTGYTDNTATYRFKYFTNFFDFGDPTRMKYMKRMGVTVVGGGSQNVTFKAGYDYEQSFISYPASLTSSGVAEYGVAEYNESAEYTTGVVIDSLRTPIGGSGTIIQAGFEAVINGAQFSIQRLDLYVKTGRVY